MGSQSDWPRMAETAETLNQFGVAHSMEVLSAHRMPRETVRYAHAAEANGLRILIAGAGGAAHLAGVLASHTTLPVIGVPLEGGPLKGLDALLATVQMPAGVPVACVALGKGGPRNAGLLAIQILAASDPKLTARLKRDKTILRRAARAAVGPTHRTRRGVS